MLIIRQYYDQRTFLTITAYSRKDFELIRHKPNSLYTNKHIYSYDILISSENYTNRAI